MLSVPKKRASFFALHLLSVRIPVVRISSLILLSYDDLGP